MIYKYGEGAVVECSKYLLCFPLSCKQIYILGELYHALIYPCLATLGPGYQICKNQTLC